MTAPDSTDLVEEETESQPEVREVPESAPPEQSDAEEPLGASDDRLPPSSSTYQSATVTQGAFSEIGEVKIIFTDI